MRTALLGMALLAAAPFRVIPSLEKYDAEDTDRIQVAVRAEGGGDGPAAEAGRTVVGRVTVSEFTGGRKGRTHADVPEAALPIVKGSGVPGLDRVLEGRKAGADLAIVFPARMNLGATAFKGVPERTAVLLEIRIQKVVETPPAPKPPPFPEIAQDDPRWQEDVSGLRILWLRKGEGKAPEYGDRIQVGWTGWVAPTKRLFDGSGSGPWLPFEEGVSFAGWEAALLRMKAGDEAVVLVPPELAYGEEGYAPLEIPGGAALLLRVSLVGVRKP